MEKLKLFILLIISLINVATVGAGELELSAKSKEQNPDKIPGNYFAYNLTTSYHNNEGKIIDGEPTIPHELPYQLAIKKFKKDIVCGAVLLSPGYALTAAHFLDPRRRITKLEDYEVVAGVFNLEFGNKMEQSSAIKEVIIHPDFRLSIANDLAILKLTDNFTLTSAVQTINISTPGYIAKGSALVSGWGVTEEGGFPSYFLLKKNLIIWAGNDIKKCKYANFDSNVMLCAGAADGTGTCSGDSGGPLVVMEGTGSKLLVGIVSASYSCTLPTIFTRISPYYGWISRNTGTAARFLIFDLHFLLFVVALQAYVQ